MALLIISLGILSIITLIIYRAIKKAPVRLEDEEKQIDAVRYEERFSDILENNEIVDDEQKVRKVYNPQPTTKEKLILSPKR